MKALRFSVCAALLAVAACAAPDAPADQARSVGKIAPMVRTLAAPKAARTPAVAQVAVGQASWYGARFQGRTTASGEPFDMHRMTAAHRTLPFGTRVRVVNEANGKSVVVRVNDRGPFSGKRIIDLSRAAAEQIGLRNKGVGKVKLQVLTPS